LSGGEDFVCERKILVVYALLNLSKCKDLRVRLIWEDFGVRGRHVGGNSGCAEAWRQFNWVGDCNEVSCSSHVWSARWRWRWWWLFYDQDMVGCSEV